MIAELGPHRFPAAPEAAYTGYIAPSAVLGLVEGLRRVGTPVLGVMLWNVGYDARRNWTFARAVRT